MITAEMIFDIFLLFNFHHRRYCGIFYQWTNNTELTFIIDERSYQKMAIMPRDFNSVDLSDPKAAALAVKRATLEMGAHGLFWANNGRQLLHEQHESAEGSL